MVCRTCIVTATTLLLFGCLATKEVCVIFILCSLEQILRVKDADKVPLVLVGNKCTQFYRMLCKKYDVLFHAGDLPDDDREVLAMEGRDQAQTMNCPFFETSAKNRVNIDEV